MATPSSTAAPTPLPTPAEARPLADLTDAALVQRLLTLRAGLRDRLDGLADELPDDGADAVWEAIVRIGARVAKG